jgi:putative transposase
LLEQCADRTFFRSLKLEQLNYQKFRTKEAAKLSVIDYLAFYNGKRMHSKLGYQTPLAFEREFYRKWFKNVSGFS